MGQKPWESLRAEHYKLQFLAPIRILGIDSKGNPIKMNGHKVKYGVNQSRILDSLGAAVAQAPSAKPSPQTTRVVASKHNGTLMCTHGQNP